MYDPRRRKLGTLNEDDEDTNMAAMLTLFFVFLGIM